MQIAILGYLIIELINVIFTSKFGFSHPMDQPLAYRYIRKVLIALRYLLVIIIFFVSFNFNLLEAIAFLIAPFLIDKIVLQFCKRREKNRLIKLYMRKSEDNPKPMSKKDAEYAAKTMVEMYSKDKWYAF